MALINDFLSLIYPRYCEACRGNLLGHERFLCNLCRVNLPKSDYHLSNEHELSRVFAGRIPLYSAMSLYVFEKSGRVQKMLHAIKYERQKELAEFLGGEYASDLKKDGALRDADVIIPVPLHEKRLRERGFNQSEWFAKGLSAGLNIPLSAKLMRRTKMTSTQTRKGKFERWENVEGVFELGNSAEICNKHIVLVDDVITTGATIEAAWQCLSRVPGIRLSVASIAFAKKN